MARAAAAAALPGLQETALVGSPAGTGQAPGTQQSCLHADRVHRRRHSNDAVRAVSSQSLHCRLCTRCASTTVVCERTTNLVVTHTPPPLSPEPVCEAITQSAPERMTGAARRWTSARTAQQAAQQHHKRRPRPVSIWSAPGCCCCCCCCAGGAWPTGSQPKCELKHSGRL
jgi:hypothetical protein